MLSIVTLHGNLYGNLEEVSVMNAASLDLVGVDTGYSIC